jgi:AraC family transcriptional regulator
MPPIVTPNDIVMGSTRALGWQDINLERDRSGPGYMRLAQGAAEHLLILHNGPARVLREVDGAGKDCTLRSGNFVLVPAAVPVAWTFDRLDVQLMTVSPALLCQVAEEMEWPGTGELRLTDRDQPEATVASVLRCLESEWKSGGERGQLYRDALVRVLACHLLRAYGNAKPRLGRVPRAPDSVLRAIEYLSDRYTSNPSLAQLADVARLNPSHLTTVFREATGLAPHQFLIHLRVERAKNWLRCGRERGVPLADLSARLGFSDQSHFIRHFKRLTGCTPHAWRTADSKERPIR